MSVDTINYGEGRKLQAGLVSTAQIPLGIDVYHPGMLLEYQADGAGVTTGTGNGVASAIVADESVAPGVWTFLFTAALVGDLSDPDGNVVAVGLAVPDGSAETFKIGGLTFTLTDGGTAWVATDSIAMTIEASGEYIALADGELSAIYNADGKTLASAGFGNAIMQGEIDESGLVSNLNAALVLTVSDRAAYRSRGFVMKQV